MKNSVKSPGALWKSAVKENIQKFVFRCKSVFGNTFGNDCGSEFTL